MGGRFKLAVILTGGSFKLAIMAARELGVLRLRLDLMPVTMGRWWGCWWGVLEKEEEGGFPLRARRWRSW